VNHELRTPLAVVIGSLECVITSEKADAQVLGLLEGSLAQAKKLSGLIENLLTFADAKNARLSVECVPGDPAAVARECYDVRCPGVAAGLRELVYRSAPTLPPARFDRLRLLQILNELIDNAVKFTPSGSCIVIAVDRATEDEREWVRIEVSDNGPGIAPDAMGSLFHSFEQVEGSMTRRVGGLGMGLAFAQRLAACMDSRLTAASTLGKGTAFRLLLPAA
jgi:signal transduction histidine kinase